MKAYERYKDSGVSWLGKIPEHWEWVRQRNLCSFYKGDFIQGKKYPYLEAKYLRGQKEAEFREEGNFIKSDTKIILVDGENSGEVFTISESGYMGSTFGALNISPLIQPKYLEFFIFTKKTLYRDNKQGSAIPHLDKSLFFSMPVPVPPMLEQEAIVKFLDYKISRIEKLISIRQRQISELKELKKAVINKAVTKGLQDVPMKDSGVTWLGKIPEHWEEKFLEQVCREKLEKNVGNKENNVLSLSYGYIVRKRDIYSGLVAKDFADYQIVKQGDIILRFTDLQNDHKSLRTGLVKETGIITSAYVCIRPTINSPYLHYLLHTYDVKKVFYGMGAGVRQSINYKDVRHILVPVPPFSEQNEISKYLDKKCTQIDKLITIREKQITELNELKARLISDAVTGKIDVR